MVHPISNGFLRNAQPKFGFGGMGMAGLANSKGSFMEKYYPSGTEEPLPKAGKGEKKNNVALSALTLLAFLFFLNILQSCLQENYPDYKHRVPYPTVPTIPSFQGNIQLQPFPQLPVISLSGQVGRLSENLESREIPADDNSLEVDVKMDDNMISNDNGLGKQLKRKAKKKLKSD